MEQDCNIHEKRLDALESKIENLSSGINGLSDNFKSFTEKMDVKFASYDKRLSGLETWKIRATTAVSVASAIVGILWVLQQAGLIHFGGM